MTIDKFGRSSSLDRRSSSRIGVSLFNTFGLSLTKNGDLDIGKRRICNVNMPVSGSDAATKRYIDNRALEIVNLRNEMRQKIFSLSNTLNSVQKQLDEINIIFSKNKLQDSVVVALPQKQSHQTDQSSAQPASMTTTTNISKDTSTNKQTRIELQNPVKLAVPQKQIHQVNQKSVQPATIPTTANISKDTSTNKRMRVA